MASTATTVERHGSIRHSASGHRFRKTIAVLIVVVAILCGGVTFYYVRVLSFSEKAVLRDLQDASGMVVSARSYHRTHFPSPGCVLDVVDFRNARDSFTLV